MAGFILGSILGYVVGRKWDAIIAAVKSWSRDNV
jgi:hypothetical protein